MTGPGATPPPSKSISQADVSFDAEVLAAIDRNGSTVMRCFRATAPGRPPEPDDYLLYPVKPFGQGKLVRGYPKQKPSVQYVHRWWYRQLEAAGLVGAGVRSGLNMHRARHTFATELRRVAGIDAASHALGHSDLSTTLHIYGHRDLSDLERDMEAFARWRRQAGEDEIVPANDPGEPSI